MGRSMGLTVREVLSKLSTVRSGPRSTHSGGRLPASPAQHQLLHARGSSSEPAADEASMTRVQMRVVFNTVRLYVVWLCHLHGSRLNSALIFHMAWRAPEMLLQLRSSVCSAEAVWLAQRAGKGPWTCTLLCQKC